MPKKIRTMLLCLGVLWTAPGCAHRPPRVEAPLGRVVVYRNGVAYFERRASVDGSFALEVPRARVDDFLKSLTVVDLSDGSPLSVSYRTPSTSSSSSVTMEIVLPPGKRDVLITYVTESPAWKPSYRVMLEDGETATLQSLAVVDNVSSEAWEGVRVGVGTTSALSFRYDLHSVRMVERETVDEGTLLAQAPPKGGSAYAVDGEEKRVLANLAEDDLADALEASEAPGRSYTQVVEASATVSRDSAGISIGGTTQAESRYTVAGRDVNQPSFGTVGASDDEPSEPPVPPPEPPLQRLTKQLAASTQRVRIEGYQLDGESDEDAALRRANTLREHLVASGIEAGRIEVSRGRGTVKTHSEVLRVTSADGGPAMTQAISDQGDDAPRGSALFVAEQPVSLEVGHSAMVTLLETSTTARRVYLFDPTTDRGSTRFAFNAIRIENPTDHTLDSGPVTVYEADQYLGEGIADAIAPHAHALVPYALDRMLRVQTEVDTHDEIQELVAMRRGVATTDTERVRTTNVRLHNRGTTSATVYVRHHVPSGWTARARPRGAEVYGDDLLVPVTVPAGEHATLTLKDSMPLQSSIDLRTTKDLVMVKRYLASGATPAGLARQLRSLVGAHEKTERLDEKLRTVQDQIAALRTRTRELRDQLLLLRASKRAQSLSSHLAKRMREVSDELDAALLTAAELKNERLQARVELSTVLAELTLEQDAVARRH